MGMQKTIVSGIGIGAGLMYFLDPGRGRRRRALVRDKAASFWSRSGDAVDTTARNLRDRMVGVGAEVRSMFEDGEHVPDQRLVERVRSKMGRVCSHPRAIDVTASDGHITLSGPVLQDEVSRLIAAVGGIQGVKGVDNRLEVHQERDIPSLQGGVGRPGYQWEIMQTNWSPSLRFVMTCVGSGLAVAGAMRRGAAGYIITGCGSAMLLRAITNKEFRRLFGIGAGRQAVTIQKTINIDAPVEEVYDFWSHFENFSKFMRHIQEVRNLGNGRSHWVATGPAGLSVRWDAVTTRQEPNSLIAWKSEPGSLVESAGMVHFHPNRLGGTQVDIQMSYNPPAGAMGHAVATIFGADPRRAMDEDLVRFKSLIENDRTSVGSQTVTRDEVMPGF
jgi:uncharacterized membrane protein